jgi:mannose-6-phosphate isomerase-like protein (cupin superfamily)
MRSFDIQSRKAWKVLKGTARSQAAEMVIKPGDSEGGPENKHPKSDQWLFVLAGRGVALIEGQEISIKTGTLLLIEKGERHQIFASGPSPLKTLNFYALPAY